MEHLFKNKGSNWHPNADLEKLTNRSWYILPESRQDKKKSRQGIRKCGYSNFRVTTGWHINTPYWVRPQQLSEGVESDGFWSFWQAKTFRSTGKVEIQKSGTRSPSIINEKKKRSLDLTKHHKGTHLGKPHEHKPKNKLHTALAPIKKLKRVPITENPVIPLQWNHPQKKNIKYKELPAPQNPMPLPPTKFHVMNLQMSLMIGGRGMFWKLKLHIWKGNRNHKRGNY